MADTLTLQSLEVEVVVEVEASVEVPADLRRSDNSVYACVALSAYSIAC